MSEKKKRRAFKRKLKRGHSNPDTLLPNLQRTMSKFGVLNGSEEELKISDEFINVRTLELNARGRRVIDVSKCIENPRASRLNQDIRILPLSKDKV